MMLTNEIQRLGRAFLCLWRCAEQKITMGGNAGFFQRFKNC